MDLQPPSPRNHFLRLAASTFYPAIHDNSLIMVQFYAPWCKFCQSLGTSTIKHVIVHIFSRERGEHHFCWVEYLLLCLLYLLWRLSTRWRRRGWRCCRQKWCWQRPIVWPRIRFVMPWMSSHTLPSRFTSNQLSGCFHWVLSIFF